MRRDTLYCSTPVGLVGGGTVDLAGVPDMGECMMLTLVLGVFFAAGRTIFQIWGKPAEPQSIHAGAEVTA